MPSRKKTETKMGAAPSPFKVALPQGLRAKKDELQLRIDIFEESIVLQDFHDLPAGKYRMVSAHDLAHAISSNLSFSSGVLPENTLWWSSDGSGPLVAIWMEPGIRRLALQVEVGKAPERYDIPLPGLIFLCRPGRPPAVFAAAKRPAAPKDRVYRAPLANVYEDGHTCPGSNRYPDDVGGVPESFLRSFFSRGAQISERSKSHPRDITAMWKQLHKAKAKEYPLSDLYYHGTVGDLIASRWHR